MRFLQIHLSIKRGGADVAISNIKLGLERLGHMCSVVSDDIDTAILRGGYDLVIFHSFTEENRERYIKALEVVKSAEIPHIIAMHDYWPFCHQGNLVMPMAGWKRCVATKDEPCSPSERCQYTPKYPLMVDEISGTDAVCFTKQSEALFRMAGFTNTHIIPHGVDTKAFTPSERPDGKFGVLFTNAWGQKEIKGYLHWKWLKDHFSERSDIIFSECLGEMGHRWMPSFLGSGDVTLFLSLWDETYGLVVAESMACGTPVISYPVGVSTAVLDAGNGILVETSNPRDVADAIERMITMPMADRMAMRSAARDAIVANYTVERMAEDYVRLAKELAS
jgi:glycosyltransferase involved in cell wall biosynthesis